MAAGDPAGTGFGFQGQLRQAGLEVNESCDFIFRLFDAETGGSQIGPSLTFDGVGANPPPIAVSAGLFHAVLDFGADPFGTNARYLEIRVRCPAGVGEYTTLTPRQPIRPVPQALHAQKAATLALPAILVGDDPDGPILEVENTADVTRTDGGGALVGRATSGSGVKGIASAPGGHGVIAVGGGGATALTARTSGAGNAIEVNAAGSIGVMIGTTSSLPALTISNTGTAQTLEVRGPGLFVQRHFFDSTESPGDAGDVLSATATGTRWTDRKVFATGIVVPSAANPRFQVAPDGRTRVGPPSGREDEETFVGLTENGIAVKGAALGATGTGVQGVSTGDGPAVHALGRLEVQHVVEADSPAVKVIATGSSDAIDVAATGPIGTLRGLSNDDGALVVRNQGTGRTLDVLGGSGLHVEAAYFDSNGNPGEAGQILSSTGTGTAWIDCDCDGNGGGGCLICDGNHVFNGTVVQSNSAAAHTYRINHTGTGNFNAFRVASSDSASAISVSHNRPGATGGAAVDIFSTGGSPNSAGCSVTQGGPGPAYAATMSGPGPAYRAFTSNATSICFDGVASGGGTACRLSTSGDMNPALQINAGWGINCSGRASFQGAAVSNDLFTIINQFGDMDALHVVGNASVNGDLCATGNIGSCSDARFKERIENLDGALTLIRGLRPVRFEWRRFEFPERRFPAGPQLGLIAQEVAAILPEVVSTDKSGFHTVDYGKLTPLLAAAVQELDGRLAHAESQLADAQSQLARALSILAETEARLAELAHRLDRLESPQSP